MNQPPTQKYSKKDIDRYTAVGLGLVVFGALFTEYAYLIQNNVLLTALGISSLLLGATTMLIPGSSIPANNIRWINGSCFSIEAQLEQFQAKERCVYLPPRDGRVFAYVPLNHINDLSKLSYAVEAPIRLVTWSRGEPGIMVFLPVSIDMFSSIGEDSNAEEAISIVLVEQLEALESVKAIESGNKVIVRMSGSRIETELPIFKNVLGSLTTSIAGCVLAYIYNKPLAFIEEKLSGKVIIATFEVLTNNE